jgi:hypothetical protein
MNANVTAPKRAKIGSRYVPICFPGTSRLMFRYDPEREIIELQDRGTKFYVDLAEQKVMLEAPNQA